MLGEIGSFFAIIIIVPLAFISMASGVKILFSGRSEYKQVSRVTKWKLGKLCRGDLADGYSVGNNSMLKEGMAFDKKSNKWLSQATISDEVIEKIVF